MSVRDQMIRRGRDAVDAFPLYCPATTTTLATAVVDAIAAPDLYEALDRMVAMQDRLDTHPSRGGGVLPVDKATTMHTARAALAKARGEA